MCCVDYIEEALLSRLIVIEESHTVQRMVEIALKRLALDITVVKSPEALSAGHSVDLLVCAAEGKWGDEAALTSQLSMMGITAPIVMLTPHGRAPEGFLGGQVLTALAKPFHTQTLVRAVCQVLDRETPDEELFAPTTKVPLKRGGRTAPSEPVEPASLITSPSAVEPKLTTPKGLIPPPAAPPQALNFQTVIGVPIPAAAADTNEEDETPSFEVSTSFGFVPEAPEGPLPTLMGGSYQSFSEAEEPKAFEPSTSFGFSPSSPELVQMGAAPPVFEEPPPAFEPPDEELEDLDDSFSALNRAELDGHDEVWESEELGALADQASAEPDLSRFAQSTSPLLNSAVSEVLRVMVSHLKEAGIEHATSDEALELISQVAWEVIPELAEQVVREEIERALGEGLS